MTRFGHAALPLWGLDPNVLYLNHGTVGAPPRRVLAKQQEIRDQIERQPSLFLLRELAAISHGAPDRTKPRIREAADAVGAFLGARGDDLVFVENASTGVNAVLRSMRFAPGDEILIPDVAYGGVAYSVDYVARVSGATVRTLDLPFPVRDPKEWVHAIAGAITPRTRLAVIDHITSESALLMPVAEIARACHEKGVPVLVDGAHGPGAIAFEIEALGVDWYTGNLHKWGWSPRSCGILWAAPARQKDLHPTVISWGLDQGFTTEFDWVGTHDPSAALAAPEAIAMMRDLGVDAIRKWNHDLAWEAAQLLTRSWGTKLEATEAMIGTMATVPLPPALGTLKEEAGRLRDALLFEEGIEVPVHPWRGGLWTRVCAQIYNERGDYERLAQAILARVPARVPARLTGPATRS
ncbi:MAG: aminotransferase class V-fold PLP-dependent enzyme [Candidatus Eiseniibacteriota bacterium]